MKKYILCLSVLGIMMSCDMRRKDKISDDAAKQNELALKETTTVQMIDSVYNFGKVMDGEKVEYNYRFKNTGTKPLVITSATATCGCTLPEKPEKPILPGEMGFIKAVFDSRARVGQVNKTITVTSNTNPPTWQLELTGEVMGKNQ